jgi:hypothetical protein
VSLSCLEAKKVTKENSKEKSNAPHFFPFLTLCFSLLLSFAEAKESRAFLAQAKKANTLTFNLISAIHYHCHSFNAVLGALI